MPSLTKPVGHLIARLRIASGTRDCCSGDDLVSGGERFTEGGYKISGFVKGTIWGPPPIKQTFDFGFASGDLTFIAGIILDVVPSVSATAGKRNDTCTPESCFYGNATIALSFEPQATVKVLAILNTFGGSYTLADIVVTPAKIIIPIQGQLGWNTKESCGAGFNGNAGIGTVQFQAVFKIAGYGVNFTRDIWGGATLSF